METKNLVYSTTRKKDGQTYDYGTHVRSAMDVLANLIRCELGFGGVITTLEPTHIVVETRVMSSLDTITVIGEAEDMRPVYDFCVIFTKVCAEKASQIREGAYCHLKDVLGDQANAFLVTNLAPLVLGAERLKLAFLMYLGINDQEVVDTAMNKGYKAHDIVAAYQLHLETGATLKEVLM